MNAFSRPVDFHRMSSFEYPSLYLEVFVAGTKHEESQFAELFMNTYSTRASSPHTADIVVFTGGPDVDPALYGVKPEDVHPATRISPGRDAQDIRLFNLCKENGIPMVGICRGAQFLHVMHGGRLYQHVEGHHGDHSMWDQRDKLQIMSVSSNHHQAVQNTNNTGMEVIATSYGVSKKRWLNKTEFRLEGEPDVEAFFYKDTCSFGVQGHPEYRGYNQFANWFLKKIDSLIICDPRITWIDKKRRLTVPSEIPTTIIG